MTSVKVKILPVWFKYVIISSRKVLSYKHEKIYEGSKYLDSEAAPTRKINIKERGKQ